MRRSPASAPNQTTRPARRLPWPLPALLAWGGAWAVHGACVAATGPTAAWLLAALAGAVLALRQAAPWRRAFILAGFPLSSLALGVAHVPGWVWLVPLVALAVLYPSGTWRDAPWFPTPARALHGLAEPLNLPAGARVLDAGCGLGHGLRALHAQLPQARIEGVEWSRPLRGLAALRCRFATVRRGDMWADDWRDFDVVYLFQRPESMARALDKAQREMRTGTWLVSLAFEAPGLEPSHALHNVDGRSVWLYQMAAADDPVAAQASSSAARQRPICKTDPRSAKRRGRRPALCTAGHPA